MGVRDKANAWKEQRKIKTRNRLNQKVDETLPEEAGARYSLISQIKKSPYYKRLDSGNDERARNFLTEHLDTTGSGRILAGQLILFEYFEPKTKEELEYYDAGPLTIFFNVVNTKEGKRVLGFNLHYFPPRMRFEIMNRIFEIYKPIYSKYFKNGDMSAIDAFDYQYLMDSLEKAGLGFGVRMYIPNLIGKLWKVPPQMWHVAAFTEGWFKKQTRAAVMRYWQQWTKQNAKKTSKQEKKKES